MMVVVGRIGESLMEMDQTKVEIRWGNCEKMADVLTGDVGAWSAAERLQKDVTARFFLRIFNV